MEFYYLLASTQGKVTGCGYYDLSSGKIIDETFLEEKLELLQTHLNELKEKKSFDFCKTEDEALCKYCEFSTLWTCMMFKHKLAYEASAGSGKTFNLVVRYLSLLFMGAKPSKVLTLTFTNKAASEMQERIVETLKELEHRDELAVISEVTGINKESLLAAKPLILEQFFKCRSKNHDTG